jgi:hypothetical protein
VTIAYSSISPARMAVAVARPALVAVEISTRPAMLWRMTLSTRLAIRLSTRFGSPATRAGSRVAWMPIPRLAIGSP